MLISYEIFKLTAAGLLPVTLITFYQLITVQSFTINICLPYTLVTSHFLLLISEGKFCT